MVAINDERSNAAKALAVLRGLTPSSPRTDEAVHWLRLAAGTANDAITTFSSDKARGIAATNLGGTARLLDWRALTQDIIDKARQATAEWISAINGDRP
jgi:hypothetical protein